MGVVIRDSRWAVWMAEPEPPLSPSGKVAATVLGLLIAGALVALWAGRYL